jgi:hypothetical protein
MPENLETAYLEPYIEATIAASSRFRRVLIVMVTASILAFGAYWNSRDEGWFNSRIVAARRGEAYLSLKKKGYDLSHIEKELTELNEKRLKLEKEQQQHPEWGNKDQVNVEKALLHVNQQHLRDENEKQQQNIRWDRDKLLNEVNQTLRARFDKSRINIISAKQLKAELNKQEYDIVEEWIKVRQLPDEKQAAEYAQKLEEARTLNILLVRIPFFGIAFDINDLGLWGGFTFVVILMIFRFSLWREYNNLRLTFREAKDEQHLEYCYKSLAMQQVMTVPPTLYRDHPPQKPAGKVVRLLYLPPLFVQAAILYNDISTMRIGEFFNPANTKISIYMSLIFLGLIMLLTYKCLQLSVKIDRVWDEFADRIKKTLHEKNKNDRKV